MVFSISLIEDSKLKLPELAVGQAMRRASGGGVVSLKFRNPGFRGSRFLCGAFIARKCGVMSLGQDSIL